MGIDFAVVNSFDGFDEISLTTEFKVTTRHYEHIYSAPELGLHQIRPEELFGGSTKEEAARIFDSVLEGRSTESQKQCVLANAAFAIQLLEPQKEIAECLDIARESLESGSALQTLRKFVQINGN